MEKSTARLTPPMIFPIDPTATSGQDLRISQSSVRVTICSGTPNASARVIPPAIPGGPLAASTTRRPKSALPGVAPRPPSNNP